MKRIMSIIIAAGLSASAFAQIYQSQPDVNQSNQFQPYPQYQQSQQNRIDGNINNAINGSLNNTTPGAGTDLQQQQQMQPQTGTIRNQTQNNYNNLNSGPSTPGTARGQQQPNTGTTNPYIDGGATGRGDSLLQTPGVPEVNPQYTPSQRRESGFVLPKENKTVLTSLYMPDPNKKNVKSTKSREQSNQIRKNSLALKDKDKTANALPGWMKDNPKVVTVPKEHQCALNNELKKREGAFKVKKEYNGGELMISRERDGEEKVKFNNNTEFYKFEKSEKGKEKFTYGVMKDYETMELRKNEDGTAEIIYHGIYPSVSEAEDAIMDGIVVDEMGKVCRGGYKE